MYEKHHNTISPPRPRAFTLTEILIVVAILALLVTMLVVGASFIQTRNKTILTKKSLDILSTAIAEFRDITGHFPIDKDEWVDRDDSDVLPGCRLAEATADDEVALQGSELLYLQLSLLPQTREIIANLSDRLLATANTTVQLASNPLSDTRYLRSIVDAWGNTINYDVEADDPDVPDATDDPDDRDDVFPQLWSNGPDGESDPAFPDTLLDDITK